MGHRILVAGVLVAVLAGTLAACGGGGESAGAGAGEAPGNYPAKVVEATFPTSQRLGETYLMRLGIRNAGRRTMPALTVTVSVGGKEGETSSLPFTIHDPQPGLEQPDRPVWVLSAGYPKLAGSEEPAGAESAHQKTFDFGPLKAGATRRAVWKLSAVKAGTFTLLYAVDAGIAGAAKAVTSGGTAPGGSFEVRISKALPETEVTGSGEVVEIPKRKSAGKGR